ncbi:hypothetical protein [Methylobacterium bullatum]|uniref:Uncharacterized protein n=1 Tax=Methylobacterium bullatum TaxID=570505 RepID=A0AAV4ZBF5_9HYPH|nr:hypothetical protein [Methylobacterium bullatum]MBD8902746.1 hypothetical protein [Methylobacterium bullatum]GJD41346.1 hypothetical protein OICFNHDK_3829 [Methylobacterium bullatum]
MSVLTVPRISASEALLGASSDLADHSSSLGLIGPLEDRIATLGVLVLLSIPYVFLGAAAAWLLGA